MKRSVFTRRAASNRRSHGEHGVGGKWIACRLQVTTTWSQVAKTAFFFFLISTVAQILPQEGQDANVAFP